MACHARASPDPVARLPGRGLSATCRGRGVPPLPEARRPGPASTRPRILRSMPPRPEILTIAGREVTVSNPDKVFFPEAAGGPITKLELVRYFVAVADGALRGAGGRPMALKRYPNGAGGDFFFQKRAPESRPAWIRTVELAFPSGRTADEIVVDDAAGLAWIANLGCLDLNPHPVRADDLDHPDELRVDLDPVPGVPWDDVRRVALAVREALADAGLVGWPKTSGSRGIHVNVRIERRWTFPDVRRAALALARDVERRVPALATSRWWKEERHGVFIDYNQNAKDRTVASAYSVRPRPDARVSAPLRWDEVADVDAAAFTLRTVPERLARDGDPHEGIDGAAGSLDGLLELSARHETEGLGDVEDFDIALTSTHPIAHPLPPRDSNPRVVSRCGAVRNLPAQFLRFQRRRLRGRHEHVLRRAARRRCVHSLSGRRLPRGSDAFDGRRRRRCGV